jgi:hypothetical protein
VCGNLLSKEICSRSVRVAPDDENGRMVLPPLAAWRTLRHRVAICQELHDSFFKPITVEPPHERRLHWHRRRRLGADAEPSTPRMKAVPDTRDDVPARYARPPRAPMELPFAPGGTCGAGPRSVSSVDCRSGTHRTVGVACRTVDCRGGTHRTVGVTAASADCSSATHWTPGPAAASVS